ncbi:alpha/beta fold hydrolase [Vibrio marisflavi]|uniref:2-succinyl-6-hydroxy-2, 4-cyclohexadiene-1-carboxylate synthase n=1 Tax=Vibrio marisflavi CECT 7928 TaxID=634439 RepID=A0ABM9A152_9VIBR|nr:alpha/beta hydrolase [Vibrio marisflavi]CAH0537171.1 2-succinyl-6-hydroxy-2, 4-cyclohexadiene-1-carboxylate synthase [Vibrio marisflavi CECT 7928]
MTSRRIGVSILSLLIGLFIQPHAFASSSNAQTLFSKNGLAYVQQGDANSKYRLIFIHGSPGSKEGYETYLNDEWLAKNAELISVDRIGYGQSPRQLDSDIASQAKSIAALLDKDKSNILIGHSLGGPIALDIAIMHPDLVQGLVLVAPAFDPKLEEPKWYNELADTWLVGAFLSNDWKVSNGEMMPLADELSKLSSKDWHKLDGVDVTLIHGDEDTISDPNNSNFAMNKLYGQGKKLVEVKGAGHFILWKDPQRIIKEIQLMLGKEQANNS